MTTTKPKGRLVRFSLRTLFVFVVLLSVPLGWFAWEMQRARRQREAVERVLAKVPDGQRQSFELLMKADRMPPMMAVPWIVCRAIWPTASTY